MHDVYARKQRARAIDQNMRILPKWLFFQLYELSDDQKRKEWLDDWLSFMHRIGKRLFFRLK